MLLAGVPVEGAQAPAGIVEGMRQVVEAGAEVVLVVRGGGSFEDLMPFNDERLARTIARCPVPVVTGIGHEPDTSIADMVADVRASTPTAAAEAASPSRESLERHFFSARARSLAACAGRAVERAEAEVRRFSTRPLFRDPQLLFAAEAQTLDLASERLSRAIPANVERDAPFGGAAARAPFARPAGRRRARPSGRDARPGRGLRHAAGRLWGAFPRRRPWRPRACTTCRLCPCLGAGTPSRARPRARW